MNRWIVTLAAVAGLAAPLAAQQDSVRIQTIPVADGIYMLVGSGGNIGLAVGEDAIFLIDDQFAPLSQKITDAIRAVSDKPVRFLLNTHWHGDHTGGNENFGKAGVLIVAHDNVRQRMSVDQFIAQFNQKVPASPKAALPVITFSDVVTFHINGDDIHAIHVKNAHTDGDAVVHWQKANVMHMGDVFFNGMYPFIDLGSGGSINGMIAAVTAALGYANESTRIIPGHGALAGKADLAAFAAMLTSVRDNVQRLVAQKKTLEQVLGAKPSAAWDEKWGKGFMKPDDFVTTVYQSLTTK